MEERRDPPPEGVGRNASTGREDARERRDATGERPERGRPHRSAERPLRSAALPESAACPFCGGTDTEQFAAFGSALSTSQYYCRSCRTVFEYMKWRAR